MVHPRASLEGGGLGVHLDTAEPLEELRNARKQKRPNDREGVLDRRVEHPILKEPHDANIRAELEAAHVHRRAGAIAEGHTLIGRRRVVHDARGVRRRRRCDALERAGGAVIEYIPRPWLVLARVPAGRIGAARQMGHTVALGPAPDLVGGAIFSGACTQNRIRSFFFLHGKRVGCVIWAKHGASFRRKL